MTSPRTTTSEAPRSARGFTLIELLLVLALAVVLAALVGPTMGGTLARVRLDAAAERLQTEWSAARLEAIRTGEAVAFRCELGSGRFRVSPLEAAGAALAADARRPADLSRDDYEELGAIVFGPVVDRRPARSGRRSGNAGVPRVPPGWRNGRRLRRVAARRTGGSGASSCAA